MDGGSDPAYSGHAAAFLDQPTAVGWLRAALVADGIPFTDGELAFVAASLFLPSIAP